MYTTSKVFTIKRGFAKKLLSSAEILFRVNLQDTYIDGKLHPAKKNPYMKKDSYYFLPALKMLLEASEGK